MMMMMLFWQYVVFSVHPYLYAVGNPPSASDAPLEKC